jgi:hypothetical protein
MSPVPDSSDERIQALIESVKAKLTVAEFGALWNVARDDGLTEGLAAGFAAITDAAIETQMVVVAVDPTRCPNPWHQTAPARMREACPECPPVAAPVDKLAANSAYGKAAADHPWPQPCIFEHCPVCR